MSAGVGADVESLCHKCGDVWHVVVAKVGESIVKVQCKQCGSQHRHKSPNGAPKEKKLPSQFRKAAEPGDKPVKAPKAPVERFDKPAVAADLEKPVQTYRASARFEVADRIDHPSFGQGVIETSEPGKITVFFATGRRVLVQSKEGQVTGGKLDKPRPFDHSIVVPGGKSIENKR